MLERKDFADDVISWVYKRDVLGERTCHSLMIQNFKGFQREQ